MRSSAFAIATALFLAGCQDASNPAQPQSEAPSATALAGIAAGQYIVVFQTTVPDPAALAQSLVRTHGGSLLHTYTSALTGFAARLPAAAVEALRRNPLVAYVEPDQIVEADGTEAMDANGDPWGLDRIDQQTLPLSGTYTYTSTGAGVNAYIIDTGIWTFDSEFGGRADDVYDAVTLNLLGGGTGEDCNGHGTHVAGTVGSATYGVAKGVFLHGVRVLNCAGLGFISDVISGVDWVTANHRSPAVANMSLGGSSSAALNTAVTNLWNSGVFLAVAAGNDNADACGTSPAGATAVFTVAASDKTDAKASFSNWGSCVDAYAPGVNIKSTWLLDQTMTLSGTSMATPHVTGVAALLKATYGDHPSDDIANWITSNATSGVISGNPSGTPNLLLFKSTL
ncbi:MAG TPA: S8 family peptidase [Gemmatimonadales bacterium]|nr:S8 family peptidase [Gemmatimonadales bacterium]